MQKELLDMSANKELNEEELTEIRDLRSDYFLDKAQKQLEALADEKNWDSITSGTIKILCSPKSPEESHYLNFFKKKPLKNQSIHLNTAIH